MNTANASLYTDFRGTAELKARARADAKGSLDQVARQFESLFTQMMLKSMRDASASLGTGIMDNDQSKFYQELYDKQIAIHLSESGGIGLADVIKSQLGGAVAANDSKHTDTASDYSNEVISMLERSSSLYASMRDSKPIIDLGQEQMVAGNRSNMQESVSGAVASLQSWFGLGDESRTQSRHQYQDEPRYNNQVQTEASGNPKKWSKSDFVQNLWPWAREAADKLGLAPAALLAQAALETGWGKHIMPSGKGGSANNLFGIKTGRKWKGDSVNIGTLEFEQGVAVRKKDKFRAYGSFRDSFNDYVEFLQANPRYSKALANTSDSKAYFRELQNAGYATDPRYAEKLTSVLEGKDMQKALRQLKENGAVSL